VRTQELRTRKGAARRGRVQPRSPREGGINLANTGDLKTRILLRGSGNEVRPHGPQDRTKLFLNRGPAETKILSSQKANSIGEEVN